MAKVKEVRVSYGQTVNLGDFESLRLDEELVIELEEGENEKQVYDAYFKQVFQDVNTRAKFLKQKLHNQKAGK